MLDWVLVLSCGALLVVIAVSWTVWLRSWGRRGEVVRTPEWLVTEREGVRRRLAVIEQRLNHLANGWARLENLEMGLKDLQTDLALVGRPDPRSVEAVRVARRYAVGEATSDELNAARDAARDAGREWQTARLLEYLRGERT